MHAPTATLLAAALICSGSAQAEQLIRKGGEWRTVTTGATPEPVTMELCFAETTMEQAMAKLAARPNCTKRSITADGSLFTLDIACGGMSMQGTVLFSGDSAYHADLTMHTGQGADARVIHSLSDATWTGACKPGEKPVN